MQDFFDAREWVEAREEGMGRSGGVRQMWSAGGFGYGGRLARRDGEEPSPPVACD